MCQLLEDGHGTGCGNSASAVVKATVESWPNALCPLSFAFSLKVLLSFLTYDPNMIVYIISFYDIVFLDYPAFWNSG